MIRILQNTSRVSGHTKGTGSDKYEAGGHAIWGGIRKPLVEKDEEIEYLKKRCVETQAELDSSGNEVERSRKFNLPGLHLTPQAEWCGRQAAMLC